MRIRTKKGFSMAEMMMTVLLMSIVLIGITSGAATIQKSYRKITNKANALTVLSTLASGINADLKMASEIKYDDTTHVVSSFYSSMPGREIVMKFSNIQATSTAPEMIGFVYLKPDIENGGEEESTPLPLLSKENYPDGLNAQISPLKFYPDTQKGQTGYFDYTITVYKDDLNSPLASQRICIRPIA